MTVEEMRKELYEYCESHECSECRIKKCGLSAHQPCKVFLDRGGTDKMSEDDISRYYAMIHKSEPGADQSAKADAGKPDLTLVPWQIVWDIAEVRMFGNAKYPEGGSDNWKRVGIERFRAALMRHLLKYLDDPDSVDEESGIEHWKHAACNMSFICKLEHERQRNECKRENNT